MKVSRFEVLKIALVMLPMWECCQCGNVANSNVANCQLGGPQRERPRLSRPDRARGILHAESLTRERPRLSRPRQRRANRGVRMLCNSFNAELIGMKKLKEKF